MSELNLPDCSILFQRMETNRQIYIAMSTSIVVLKLISNDMGKYNLLYSDNHPIVKLNLK